jgi:hypothetical protein
MGMSLGSTPGDTPLNVPAGGGSNDEVGGEYYTRDMSDRDGGADDEQYKSRRTGPIVPLKQTQSPTSNYHDEVVPPLHRHRCSFSHNNHHGAELWFLRR